ncbi:ABC transporter ATP-binding protein [Amorphus orientalis]|uniref:ABC-type branched-subunit amino acid transport system ATPase component n=1 Tax=Amorphus orientalis TaxID=649198 RepID=A0AAE3VRK0_9HYPH|nr:ABC transporter ATP-binding protein [Amorphus orientalis]MDQ0316831.1 ABC-type branched-subunit amino acid transport system ATPase component [Amorphus orientalis]
MSFEIAPGEVAGLIGPNGAGKSTMFSMVAGELKPTQGEILFAGERIDPLPANEIFARGLVRSFQIPRPFRRLTVLENMLVARPQQRGDRLSNALFRPGSVRREETAATSAAREILQELGLLDHQNRMAGGLSGGQHKLLELARALMSDPKAILLDEPCAGVAPAMIEHLSEAVERLRARGITVVLVEHNVDFVMRHCDHIVVMAQGRVMIDGAPEVVRNDERVLDAFLGAGHA